MNAVLSKTVRKVGHAQVRTLRGVRRVRKVRAREMFALLPPIPFRPFSALKQRLREGYTREDLKSDLMSGTTVGMVAIPLGMALAIASGVTPQSGLYTVIIAGAIIALLGGSRCQVSGPTAAFVVILAPIAQKFGFGGLLIAGIMAGALLALMGVAQLGRLIQFIPHPVTTGFTAGIAVVIATLQLKDFFGLQVAHLPETFLGKVVAMIEAGPSASPVELTIGAVTLAMLIYWPKVSKRVPAPLAVLTIVSLATIAARHLFPEIDFATIGSRFHGIPQVPPTFTWPWNQPGPNGEPLTLSPELIEALVPSALAIAILGAIESLLSAVVADAMAQTRHDPDAELVGLGIGNMICPFFGGIAATGAIARTATNVRSGAKSPISALWHSVFTLLVILLFAPIMSYLPMAALAALLVLVAYNMSEVKRFIHIAKVAPPSDVVVMLVCFSLTVLFDMVVGVTVGIVFAALLFMKRMAEVTSGHVMLNQPAGPSHKDLPRDAVLYEIAGPLFFGAADNAVGAIGGITDHIRTVIFNLHDVPVMDVTGLVAFESSIERLLSSRRQIILAGIRPQPRKVLSKAGLLSRPDRIRVASNLDEAILIANGIAPSAERPLL